MINLIENRIKELEFGLSDNIRQVQIFHLPSMINIELIEKEEYRYQGDIYIAEENERIFLVNNLPIKSTINKSSSFDKPLLKLVNDIIHPFILFINKRAIKWSNIQIVYNLKYTYMVIKDLNDDITDIKTLRIPYRVRYGEDSTININYKGNFYFNASGKLTTDISKIAMRVEIISSELNCTSSDYSKGYIEVESKRYNQPATVDNIIIFKDGELVLNKDNLEDKGYNIFNYNSDTNNTIFKTFYYNKGNSSNDNLYKLDNVIVKDDIINNNPSGYIDKLKTSLDIDTSYTDRLNIIYEANPLNIKSIPISDNKFIILYNEIDTRKGLMFIVEYINGELVSGPIYEYSEHVAYSPNMIRLNDSKFILFYTDIGDTTITKSTVITISDINMIIGAITVINNSTIFDLSVSKLDNNTFIICYSDLTLSRYGVAQHISFTNNYSVVKSTLKYIFTSENISKINTVKVDGDSICVSYVDNNCNGIIYIITMDSLGVEVSHKYIYTSDYFSDVNMIKISDNKLCLAYLDNNMNIQVKVLNVNGNSISMIATYTSNHGDDIHNLTINRIDDHNILIGFNHETNVVSYEIISIKDKVVLLDNRDIVLTSGVQDLSVLYVDNMMYYIYIDNNGILSIYSTHNYHNKLNKKIEKIMTYNPELLESIYNDLTPFETGTYTGSEINSRVIEGHLTMPRRRYNNIFCTVIMFVNGELYDRYNEIEYINDKFKIPISDINDTDEIEFIFIKNIDTSIKSITIPSKDIAVKTNSKFNNSNIRLFSSEYDSEDIDYNGIENSGREYELDDYSKVVYNVPFTTIDNGNSKYNILLNNDFYYNKELHVVSTKLFKYKSFVVDYNQVDVSLGEDFKYCIDRDKYLVFINNRVINQDNFVLAVPGYHNPFDQVILYINIIMEPGDKIDVFYLPFKLNDIYNKNELNNIQGRNLVDLSQLRKEGLVSSHGNIEIASGIKWRSVVAKVTSNTTYILQQSGCNRLWVQEYSSLPKICDIADTLNKTNTNPFIFKTKSDTNYLYIYLCNDTDLFPVENYKVQLVEGNSINGDIEIDKNIIPFGLTNNNYWYFINGKKINPNSIENISDHRISIKSDYKSVFNFNIKRFMDPIEVFSKLVADNDVWNEVIDSIGLDINKFYQSIELTNTEENIKLNETDMRATVMEAFRHYYAKYNISADYLVYDFNDILISGDNTDGIGNYHIDIFDANSYNSVDVDR